MIKVITNIINNSPILSWIIALAIVILVFEIIMTFRYRFLAQEAQKRPVIYANDFIGAISEEFKQGASSALHFQMSEIIKVYRKIREEFGFRDAPVEIGKEFAKMMALASESMKLDPYEHPKDYKILFEQLESINIKIKFIKVRLSTIIKTLIIIFRWVPAPYRNQYQQKIINVSFLSMKDQMQIRVFRRERRKKSSKEMIKSSNQFTYSMENENESEIFRNAAFMILELYGKVFPGLKWKGMRYFTDGLSLLDQYRRKPQQNIFDEAKKSFTRAVEEDKEEYEACCFLGSMLMSERRKESINKAIRYLEQALNTDRPKFKAFVHAGLAHCYAQQIHRLAMGGENVLRDAKKHADLAIQEWKKADPNPHPWIRYIQALVLIIDEGGDRSPGDMKKQFIPAINICHEAIQGEKTNGLFHNTLGWMLLKLTEKGVKELITEEGITMDLVGNVAELSEQYLLKSISLHDKNKLSHANLCLLYATPYFRNRPENYLRKCENSGIKAINIDPDYINGYRDLTVSMIRYKQLDDAYKKYYLKALELAQDKKDEEIMTDVKNVLIQMKVNKEELKRWEYPPEELLKPPSTVRQLL